LYGRLFIPSPFAKNSPLLRYYYKDTPFSPFRETFAFGLFSNPNREISKHGQKPVGTFLRNSAAPPTFVLLFLPPAVILGRRTLILPAYGFSLIYVFSFVDLRSLP